MNRPYFNGVLLFLLLLALLPGSEQPGPRLRIVRDGQTRTLVTVTT